MERDPKYEDAVRIVTEAGLCSVSLVQRRLEIGYSRASRLVDAMEANGVVGPYEGSAARRVLVPAQHEASAGRQ